MLPKDAFRRRLSDCCRMRSAQVMLLSPTGRTYHGRALLELIEQTEAYLAGLGFGRGHRVVSTLVRGVESSAAALAIGSYCSYVPVNAEQSATEWVAMLQSLEP